MAIGVRTPDTAVNGVNSFTPTITTTQVVGDMMILIVAGKPFDAGWSAPAGWTSLGRGQSGTTAAGVDTGSMAIEAWYKEATADPETNPLVTEGTPAWNVAFGVVQVFSKAANEVWSTPVAVFGADETSGTAIAVTYASDPGVTTGDMIVTALGVNTDSITPLTAALTPAQTGVTFGATTSRTANETTSGGDMGWQVTTTPVNSGTGSAAPTASGTGTASGGADRLESIFIRLRVTTVIDNRAEVSWATVEVPAPDNRSEVSWATVEVPSLDNRSEVSWAAVEVPDPVVDNRSEVSWVEIEVPDISNRSEVSWAELEVPTPDNRAEISWATLEVPPLDNRAEVSWLEVEVPALDNRAEVSWAEFEVPDVGGGSIVVALIQWLSRRRTRIE